VSETPARPTEPHKRGRFDTSFYTSWAAFNPGGEIKVSADFHKNGKEGERFVKATKSLWKEASHFMEDICPGQYRELRKARLPPRMRKQAGVWSGFVVNKGSEEALVETTPHRDYKSIFYGKSCLYPFGDFEGGAVILWDLRLILELKAGDLFLFEDHLLMHSNEPVRGERHSLVAFMRQRVLDQHNKEFGKEDKKRKKSKADQRVYRVKQSTRAREAEERRCRRRKKSCREG
jgi:hypothetical protein